MKYSNIKINSNSKTNLNPIKQSCNKLYLMLFVVFLIFSKNPSLQLKLKSKCKFEDKFYILKEENNIPNENND